MTQARGPGEDGAYEVTVKLMNPVGELPFLSSDMQVELLAALGVRRPILSFSETSICLTCEVEVSDAEMAVTVVRTKMDEAFRSCDLPPLRLSGVTAALRGES